MIQGTAYGVALNDVEEIAELSAAFEAPPYVAPPRAPVLYIKPRNTFLESSGAVPLPAELSGVSLAATLALVIGEEGRPTGARLALDISEPHDSYFRPAIRERCRDGFLPLGGEGKTPRGSETIVTTIDGREVHRWSLDRLARPIGALLDDIGAFMSLLPGDLLLIGLPGDAPSATVGQTIEVRCDGYPSLTARLTAEVAA